MNWKAINPDIFGSMIQAVVHTGDRREVGMHYTSVPNIMKVIKPLFLNDLREQLEKSGTSKTKLKALLERLYNLRIFDPACGSGNFLIIAYKELCRLEIEAFRGLGKSGDSVQMDLFRSNIQLTQLYGIELDDFAHETAKLSLWLAEHQMNLEFELIFGATRPTLPLQDGGNIVCGNATRLDWESVCPKVENAETLILGNPPYAGQRNHTDFHRQDMGHIFQAHDNFKKLDYISCWFYIAATYIDESSRFSFVTTNSISQGTQVAMLWPKLFSLGVEIAFSYAPFKWSNNARHNAGVTCTVIGMRRISKRPKHVFHGDVSQEVDNINAYLVGGANIIVEKRSSSISELPKMHGGNQPREGGYLIVADEEKCKLLDACPEASRFVRPFLGSNEFIKGIKRWCLWIDDDEVDEAMKIGELKRRIESVRQHRENGNSVERSFAHMPHRFVTVLQAARMQLLIPIVSSENRKYIPIGMLDRTAAVSSKAYVIFDCEPYVFGVLTSILHMTWVKAVSGRLGTGISYSAQMCFHTFPFPRIAETHKAELEENVFAILDQREAHSEKTLAELYDPDKMPDGLRKAHHEMDLAVERCYRKKPFTSDEERLEYLFGLYEQMIEAEKNPEATHA